MKRLKRIAAILLACVLLVSTLCVPAFAAEDSSVVVTFHSYDVSTGEIGGEITSANAGDYVIAVLGLKAGSEGLSAIAGCQLYAKYDASILVPGKTGKAPFKALAYNVGSNTTASEFAWTMSGANKSGAFNAVGGGSSDLVIDAVADEVITLGQYAFKVAADVESVATAITLDSEKNNVVFYYPEGSSETQKVTGIDMDNVYTLNVIGVAPTLDTVTLDKASVLADGTNASTVKAAAASAKGTDITNNVAWTVAPADKGVTVAADGTITVDAKAEAGSYTVTATADGTNVLGTTATATFTVTRNPAVLTSLTLDKSAVTVDGKDAQTVTADLKDQYGSDMTADITVAPAEGITVSGKTITVAKNAAEGTYTVTAGDKTATFTVTRAGAGVVTEFNAKDVADPVIIPADDTVAEVSLAANVSDAKDVYGDTVSNPSVTFTLDDSVAGITIEGSTLKVTKAAAAAIESSEVIEVEATINGVKEIIKVTVERAPSVATSLHILSDGAEVTGSITVGIPTTGKAFTVEVRDQYGAAMEAAAALTLEDADAGITINEGKLVVADTTTDGATATLKATCTGLEAKTVSITAKKVSVNWAEVSAETEITYGATNASAITLPAEGKGTAIGYVDGVATTLTGTYSVKDATAVQTVGSKTVQVDFVLDAGQAYSGTFSKTYTVDVKAATLTLTDGTVAITKEYDTTTAAGALTGALALTGIFGSDDVSVNMTGVTVGAYPSADYGTHTVTLSGIALTGAAAANYTVASTYDFAGATITKTVLKVSDFTVAAATEATYDGTAKTVTVTPNVTGAGAITVLYNGETSAVNAGEYAITINVAEGNNYAAATGLDLGAKLTIAKAERTITPDAATIVLVGETPVDVKITTDAEAEVSVSTSVDEVIVLESYSANVATFTALNDDVTTVTFAAPESDNYLAGSATVKAISVASPIDGYGISEAFNVNCDYDEVGQITLTAESVNPELVEIEFFTPTVEGATITLNPANPIPLATTELTVTIEAAGQTIVVPYTVSISIEKVAAKINPVDDEFGIIDVLPDEVYGDIYDAAEKAGADEVDVSISTEVKVEDGKVTITPTYTVTDTETDEVLIENGAIESTTDPVVVDVEVDEADDTKLMVKNAAGEYEIVTVADGKITVEVSDFTASLEIVEPATITINYTYNKVKEDGSTPASVEYDIDDVGTALPTDEKSGNTFKGWTINGKVYTTLTVDLLDTEDGTEYDATASFKKKSSGGIAYVISVEDADNGTVKASKKTAGKGDTVTITVKPDKGYELDELTVTDKDGDELKLKSKGDGKYTFTMPKGKVYVEATFVAVEAEVEASFSDVAETDSYFNAVEWAVAEGITTGYANGTFLPNNTVTRAQAVTFLWRAMGEPKPETTEMPFVDVPVGSYYYDAVLWAVENGITTGMTATTFVPDKTVSRAQTITFLWRTAKMEGYDVSVGAETNILSYADAMTIGEYAIPAMQWACGEEIMSSYADGTLRPNDGCTRAQTVTFLYRFLG